MDACTNFYEYACGAWRRNNPVPGDKARTKVKAQEKLRLLGKRKIGYPDTWLDYSKATVSRGDYAGNTRRASRDAVRRDYEELGKPVDRTRWRMTPPTVNAGRAELRKCENAPGQEAC